MGRRNWKRVQPQSLRHSMELCLDYGRDKKNLSVDRVADLMGIPSKWTLYKYLESGKMPANLIRPFEHATGATFITQYIGSSAQKLLIDIPSGKSTGDDGLLDLQCSLNESVRLLTLFYRGQVDAAEVLSGITDAMQELAGHRENVRKHGEPELDLFGEGEV